MDEEKTVRVRIAVAVDKDGKWSACGLPSYESWDEAMDCWVDDLAPGEAQYWVEATLPIPAIETVEGEVKL